MSFKIEYFDGVSLSGTCRLRDDQLKTSTNQTIAFPTDGGELALKSDIAAGGGGNVEVDLSELEADVQDIADTIAANNASLVTSINSITDDVTELTSSVSSIESDASTMKSNVTTACSNIDSMKSDVATMKSTVSSIQTTCTNLLNSFTTAMIKAAYPVGTVIIRTTNANPDTLTGFTPTTWSLVGSTYINNLPLYWWRRTA